MLAQILTPEAAERLGRIRLVKAARAANVESRLIVLARAGQLSGRVTEAQLKEMLGAVAEHESASQKITVERRKGWDDEEDDLLAELER
jgi:programmed cell death protein 5